MQICPKSQTVEATHQDWPPASVVSLLPQGPFLCTETVVCSLLLGDWEEALGSKEEEKVIGVLSLCYTAPKVARQPDIESRPAPGDETCYGRATRNCSCPLCNLSVTLKPRGHLWHHSPPHSCFRQSSSRWIICTQVLSQALLFPHLSPRPHPQLP